MSDKASTSILELKAWADGDSVFFEGKSNSDDKSTSADRKLGSTAPSASSKKSNIENSLDQSQTLTSTDDLYHEFIKTASSTDTNQDTTQKVFAEWISRLTQLEGAKERITSIFLLSIPTKASDAALKALYDSGYVDIHALDEINNQSVLHKAAMTGRTLLVDLALSQNVSPTLQDTYGRTPLHYACLHNHVNLIEKLVQKGANIDALDKDNFSPLLCAIISKNSECVKLLINLGAKGDGDSEKLYIPLNFACQYGIYDATQMILARWPNVIKPDAEGLYPIHIVSRAGHHNLIPLLTKYNTNVNQVDKLNKWTALFYAASEGHALAVKELLKANAHVDILDEDGHTPLYYATWEGHVECVEELSATLAKSSGTSLDQSIPIPINNETNSSTSAAISIPSSTNHSLNSSFVDASSYSSSLSPNDMDIENSDIDGIPDLSLPPPILPLRRYGHNFLDKKIFVQLLFDTASSASAKVIEFDKGDDILPAGRLTISSRNNHEIIPQSIILPFSETDKNRISFQVDSLENFAIDFEIYPTYGTKIVAKTAALSYIFNQQEAFNPESQHILGTRHFCTLPLFDMRLQTVGRINFAFQVVLPFAGKPLEITKFDTYWKSTSQVDQQQQQQQQQTLGDSLLNSTFPALASSTSQTSQVQMLLQSQRSGSPFISNTLNSIINAQPSHSFVGGHLPAPAGPSSFSSSFHHHHHGFAQTLSLVTASSLSGEFARISVCLTRDMVPVVANFWTINISNTVDIPIGHLNLDQVLSIASSGAPVSTYISETRRKLARASSPAAIHNEISEGRRIIPLKDFLEATPVESKLDISVLYPTRAEAVYINLGANTFPDLNVYVDKILTVLFDHVRQVRSSRNPENAPYGSAPSQTRSVIFSAAHPDVCTVLNWKQPNYPVFFHVNAIKVDTDVLYGSKKKGGKSDSDGDVQLNDFGKSQARSPAFSVVSAHGLPVQETDRRCTSLKDATLFAANNNLLGLVVSADLLSLVPSLVSTIRVFGLVLVSEYDGQDASASSDDSFVMPAPSKKISSARSSFSAARTSNLATALASGGAGPSHLLSSPSSLSSFSKTTTSAPTAPPTTATTTTSGTTVASVTTSPLISSLLSSTLTTPGTVASPSGQISVGNIGAVPSSIASTTSTSAQQMALLPGVDGLRSRNTLKFKGAIDM